MAMLFTANDAEPKPVKLNGAPGSAERLEHLQRLVGGCIEVIRLPENRYLVLNETGKISTPMLPLNFWATAEFAGVLREDDFLVGDVVAVELGEMA